MSVRGKSINLFLMDGDADGRIKCTLSNWTGVALKIPRSYIDKCKDREELKQTGVYFLFGREEETEKHSVYIGQASSRKNGEGILVRVREHMRDPDKDFWTEAIVFTTSNDSLGPTEISYLENRFCNLAIEAGAYKVKNGNDPSIGNLTEEKISEMEEFIDYAKIVMGALGHKVFVPLREKNKKNDLYLKHKKADAVGKITSDGFTVFKGSKLNPDMVKSCRESTRKLREKYKNCINKDNELTEDLTFTSPSAAGDFLTGSSISGNLYWKNSEGKSLKDLN